MVLYRKAILKVAKVLHGSISLPSSATNKDNRARLPYYICNGLDWGLS